MPKVTFLGADRPLVKSYSLDSNNALQKESYPSAFEFTSHTYEYSSLQELYELIRGAAAQGWCMLKGDIQRPLVNESRAGSTDPNTPTSLVCYDFDRMGLTIEEAMVGLNRADVSYIVQYSASYGIELDKGYTAHVFILLSAPMAPAALKQWLISLNLRTPSFRKSIELTKTNNALSWPLDISTCQNDKLIYIAPPVLGQGVSSGAVGERIQLVTKPKATLDPLTLTIPTAEANRAEMNALLDELRAAKHLPKRGWNTKIDKTTGLEILLKPDATTMTATKRERGFVYFNLNGGDSWGYYHPDDAPEVIRNFKGEANYATADLLPEYWSQVQLTRAARAIEQNQIKETLQSGDIDVTKPAVLAFRDFKSALYYNGSWDPATETLTIARAAGLVQVQHHLLENGLPEVDYVPTWNLIFDPQSDVRVDVENKTLNTFQPSIYMKQAPQPVEDLDAACPNIARLLSAAVGNSSEVKAHYLNWLGCIFRLRERTGTSWVLHGIEGTGKGMLLNRVIIPLLGYSNVVVKRMEELEDQFNGYAEFALFVAVDEAEIGQSRKSKMIMANLKNMITEPLISVRKMHTASYAVPNHCNFMFSSNRPDVVTVARTDRRFNVAEFRSEVLGMTDAELDAIEGELEAFANYLYTLKISSEQARTILHTADRDEMAAVSQNSIEITAQALLAGDLAFFWDALPAGAQGLLGADQQALHDDYTRLVHDALRNTTQRLTRDELRIFFAYNVGDVPRTPAKFTSMLRHHRIPVVPTRINGRVVRGFEVNWKVEAVWLKERLEEIQEKMKPLKVVA